MLKKYIPLKKPIIFEKLTILTLGGIYALAETGRAFFQKNAKHTSKHKKNDV